MSPFVVKPLRKRIFLPLASIFLSDAIILAITFIVHWIYIAHI
ncbi:hypothetical protein RU95_GL003745 [Enterococcus avium]|nr:hypothetical protein RU95_GL003745 [Enterococcus avium]